MFSYALLKVGVGVVIQNLDLMVPTPDDLAQWKGLENALAFEEPITDIQLRLRLATDLLILATGITRPVDPNTPVGRIVKAGLCDMAWFIGSSLETREEQFSPFQSETIGSYTYSKAAKAVQLGNETGVPFFDQAVAFLLQYLEGLDSSFSTITAEKIFPQPFHTDPVQWAVSD